ncbi:MAG: ABC transporter ATP-binding protein [Caldilineaceae bacterium]|nr:ABC transporter ATP-binding protein [Caldilineaceae bacterium]MCB0139799.1 ABC transporter ATP-binding protein [Caldilineaceae bacterium]
MKSLRRVIRYLSPYKFWAVGATLSLILVTAMNLVTPQLLRWVVDGGITAKDGWVITWGTAALAVVAIARGIFNFTQTFWGEQASQSVAFDMRNELYAKIQGLSFSYHDQAQTGQLMTRATNDVDLVRQFIGQGLFQVINAVVMVIGSASVLLWMNWELGLVTLLTVPAIGLVLAQFARNIRPMFGIIQKKLGGLNSILQENLAGIRVVKAFARSGFEEDRFEKANTDYKETNLDFVRAASASFPLIFLFSNFGTILILGYGGFQVIGNRLSVGELVAFNTYLMFLVQPMMTIGFVSSIVIRAGVSAERIFEVLDAANAVVDNANARTLPPVVGRVEFENVRFRYVGQEQDVLAGVSFIAEPGQTVAILGSTGSGKSTIINLLPRFYDVTDGRVLVDGQDVREVTLDSLRSQIGIVLQETTLFSGTIRDNIAYGRPDATDEEVLAAAKAAQAHNFILEQPKGYETEVGERGVGLSGGQKQRVAIARALLLDPRILILDDSTSAVDAETEYQIQQALDKLMVGRTSFVIAQRISTVRNAGLVLVLDKGRIAASGTHESLMMDSPLYAEIVQSQLRQDTDAKGQVIEQEAGELSTI